MQQKRTVEIPIVRSTGIPVGGNERIRVVVLSDTHNMHSKLDIPEGDILIHCGDFTHKNDWKTAKYPSSLTLFNEFLGTLPHPIKLVVAGNHEIGFNNWKYTEIQELLSNCIYLSDTGVKIHDLFFWGTPWTTSSNMAFSCRSRDIHEKWEKIPSETDILISHLPPKGILDLGRSGDPDFANCSICLQNHPNFHHWDQIHS
jgi:hypothetical protein